MVSFLDPEMQMDARYSGLVNRTLQVTDGTIYALTAGARYAVSDAAGLVAEAFYSPLTLVRRPGGEKENQDFFNIRVLVTYRLR